MQSNLDESLVSLYIMAIEVKSDARHMRLLDRYKNIWHGLKKIKPEVTL